MKGIDTNVLVRFLVKDDLRQAQRARKVIASGPVWIPKTVLLETEWVLRYTYELEPASVNQALTKVCGMRRVVVEDAPSVTQALSWHADGFDFADALHLASCPGAQVFYSFDQSLAKMAKMAKAADAIPVEKP